MNIPMNILKSIEDNKKNVLIISMSTLQVNNRTNYYYVKHKGKITSWYCGEYSMEPGTKHVLNKLGKEKRKLDKIIMLSTPEARNESKDEKCKNAVEHYINEIKRFIKQGDVLDNCDKLENLSQTDKEILVNFETKIDTKYSEEELENLFVEIKLGNVANLSYEAIPEIVDEVLKISDNGVNLYLDMQGGSRVSTFIINAAVNMLRDENINLERSYATLYNRSNQAHQLKDESLSNRIFDMVSGMDEFLNYGRAKKFKEYFKYYKEEYKKVNKLAEDPIVETICDISDAISICNIEGFYKGLDRLKKEIDVYRKKDSELKDAIFQAFIQKIEKTYGVILSRDRRAIDVMEWCLQKEWYQQALTVCEAKVPEQMIKEKVVYYCKTSGEKDKELQKLSKYYNSDEGQKYCKSVKDSAIFVIKNYKYNKDKEKNRKDSLIKLIVQGELYSDYYPRSGAKLEKVIDKYFELARERNKVNHAGESVDLGKLKITMEQFIAYYQELVQDNWKTNYLSDDCMFTMNEIKKYNKSK